MSLIGHRYSLFAKFSIGITLSVALFGILNILVVKWSVTLTLNNEIDKRGYFIARTVAEQSVSFLLMDNSVELNKLINEIHDIDSSVYYIFLINNKNKVVAHSFNHTFPLDLALANKLKEGKSVSTVLIQSKNDKSILIKDFAIPVLNKDIGIVRVGILENKILNEVKNTVYKLLLMVVVFIVLGIIGALFFSYIIATPIKFLSRKTETIDINSIETGMQQILAARKSFFFKIRRMFNTEDEIDILYEKFILMLNRLSQTHQKLNVAQQSLLQSEKMASIGTLTAGIAHEINNPLAGINNCLQRIAKKTDDAEQTKKYIVLMQEAISRIKIVVQDLLNFSRKSNFEFRTENICDIINRTITLVRYRIGERNINITFNDAKKEYYLNIEANRIEQVFINIIFNAVDAIYEKMRKTHKLKGEINITINHSGKYVMVEISDNGIGIENNALNSIFDPFFTTKKVGTGTGLGLSVCYQIINDHGGEIMVKTIPDKGSTFIICLPKNMKK